MFDRVFIHVSERSASERFYATVLETLGVEQTLTDEHAAEWGRFGLVKAAEQAVTRRLHIAFFAASQAEVNRFWAVGTAAGYRDDGAPGLRPQYADDYYGAFLLDPDGNSAEAVHHGSPRGRGQIDHLWLRVADVAASRRFYETAAPYGGFRLSGGRPERAHFAGENGSFSVVLGPSTEHAHMAFRAGDRADIDRWHREASAAGYLADGAPRYDAGRYSASIRDPDGNTVELVSRDRR